MWRSCLLFFVGVHLVWCLLSCQRYMLSAGYYFVLGTVSFLVSHVSCSYFVGRVVVVSREDMSPRRRIIGLVFFFRVFRPGVGAGERGDGGGGGVQFCRITTPVAASGGLQHPPSKAREPCIVVCHPLF